MTGFIVIIVLSIVEGVTEFIPISSTGHMILVKKFLSSFMATSELNKNFMDTFLIVVQFGAILAVIICFWKNINPFIKDKTIFKERMSLWSKIIVGVIPAGVIGILADDYISEVFMDNITIIAVTLIFYGVILIFIEKKITKKAEITNFTQLTYKIALTIGFFQCLAMIPGTSRSGATIIGALLLGLSRPIAAEFSFFLAIPTMAGATLLKLMKNGLNFTNYEWLLMSIGTLISFIVAYIVIKWFMTYIKSKDFVFFGIYRVILGVIVLLLI
ncbi:MAG: undecaprenyl-diphosphate phosphatase [Fusobacteriaceae bacterium]